MRLCELEVLDRERRAMERRIRHARFPVLKSLDSFHFSVLPSLNKGLLLELARCGDIPRKENVLVLGNSGTGKTHIALGLGWDWLPVRRAARCALSPPRRWCAS